MVVKCLRQHVDLKPFANTMIPLRVIPVAAPRVTLSYVGCRAPMRHATLPPELFFTRPLHIRRILELQTRVGGSHSSLKVEKSS
ncbi:hypothetical protein Q1695_013667 [Nippostrongylus brasiliensis]|nr:hypothetical protein Q1695_013667 [Nippostrongylus brasiliensis]